MGNCLWLGITQNSTCFTPLLPVISKTSHSFWSWQQVPKSHKNAALLLPGPCRAELLPQWGVVLGARGTAHQPPASWGTCWSLLWWLSPSEGLAGLITPAQLRNLQNLSSCRRSSWRPAFTWWHCCFFGGWFCKQDLLLTNSLGQLAGETRPHWMAKYSKPKWQDYTSSSLKLMREIRVLVTMIKQNRMCMKHA